MKQTLTHVWSDFVREFPGGISPEEGLTADMIILLRNQWPQPKDTSPDYP